MTKRYEVFYTYCVDASVRVDANSEAEAIAIVTAGWLTGDEDVSSPKTLDYTDFEVLYAKKR